MAAGYGAFGKMPSVGDFFRIAAPPGFVEAWDPWVQQALLGGQQAFGAGWDGVSARSFPTLRRVIVPSMSSSPVAVPRSRLERAV